ncbi:MAG: CRISPR-associated helicase Cas3' [Oscillospiraceae bacterium]|nr:CRISPR-associated helicase Cas3' [Oscillospiraceae bacterium]
MVYLAHISEDHRRQTVLQHLEGTAGLCARFAAPFGAGELGKLVGLAHDIGKYSEAFQRRLQGEERVDHATAGAYECYRRRQTAAAFCVAGHHGGLPDGGSRGDSSDLPTFLGRMRKAMEGKLEPYAPWEQEVSLPQTPAFQSKSLLDAFFFIRMLYSCLVDADYLDTERFMTGETPLRGYDVSMETLYQRLERYISAWFPPQGEVNTLRCTVLEQCIQQGSVQKPGLFTLTVPTGGGKTVASLAFALRHASAHRKTKIIYVIPYTSIIEQTAGIFQKILGAENVLEHHSSVRYDTDSFGAATPEAAKRMRAAENWDMPVIVTTAVQFFESLYANRSSQCRKLHNLTNSVIIFDEAQMLPLPYLRPCVSAIAQLVAHYGVSAVLCTATQPALSPLFQEFLPGVVIPELCATSVMRSPVFQRVRFQKAGKLTWQQLHERLQNAAQVLCIVNSRKNAQLVFEGIQRDGGFHLSTLMTPSHRKAVLAEIRRRLKEGLPCRVVSTSLIEAGVDVDFPLVFREEAGLDSILQAAGRCNREGRRPVSESIVTVFRAETAPPQIFSAAIAAGQEAMDRYDDLSDPDAVSCYFHALLDLKGREAQDQKGILLRIQKGGFPFRTVAEEFRLIEQDTHTVYIPIGDGEKLVERLRQGERSRQLFRELGQYGVSVYAQQFQILDEGAALELLEDGSAILTDLSLYSDDTGLTLNVDSERFMI